MTVERAVATASGYTYRANHKKVYIKRANATDEVQLPLDSKLVIEPGDTIRIVERYF
jgi:polysaccharide export outer membrane protein